ncbi:hypothetical protein KM043_015170 [Ampulex compressa]|nr:hypothetical protein KM043_015170 [Ampulex compressa]
MVFSDYESRRTTIRWITMRCNRSPFSILTSVIIIEVPYRHRKVIYEEAAEKTFDDKSPSYGTTPSLRFDVNESPGVFYRHMQICEDLYEGAFATKIFFAPIPPHSAEFSDLMFVNGGEIFCSVLKNKETAK